MREPQTKTGRRVNDSPFGDAYEEDIIAIEDEMLTMFEQVPRAAIFDLPIGENVDYSRGYSAAVAENRRALLETIGDLRKGRP